MLISKPPILWRRGALWLAFMGLFFFLTYGAVNYFTSTRADVGVIVYAWERHLPFVPWLMLPYMSIDAFYAASLFLFRKRGALDRHALRLLLATIISLLGFLLYPLQFSLAVPKIDGFNGALQAALLGFDQPYNQAPSLHISLLIILWQCYASKLQSFARLALHLWFFAIAASVLLVYQHHFVDVWTGALVGVLCLYAIPDAQFTWRLRRPTISMKKIGGRYALGATICLLLGVLIFCKLWLAAALLVWTALALYLVVAAYFGFDKQIFQRSKGCIVWPAIALLSPYLLGSWLSYRYYTRSALKKASQIQPYVWLGAYPRVCAEPHQDWYAVLDLTCEFARPARASLYKNVAMLDLAPPAPSQLVRAVRWLDARYNESSKAQNNVLVHCALGLSRSASVLTCWLAWRGHAANVEVAIHMLNARRAGIKLSAAHIENIQAALQQLRTKYPD